jgi:molecular chaperone GrpE
MEQNERPEVNSAEDATALPAPASPPSGAPSGEGVQESPEVLRESLAAQRQAAERLQERLLRIHAEFENYKRRMARERVEFLKFATEGLILEFLPVLDNLERALAAARSEVGSTPLVEGIEMIARMFRSSLEKAGATPMETLGQPFDPGYHQAVAQVESPLDAPQGAYNVVVEEVQRGYLLNGRVLRPAMVKVSSAAGPASGTGSGIEGAEP